MVEHHVDNDLDAARMALGNERAHILHRTVFRVDGLVVSHVIFVIAGTGHDGHEPDTVIAHILDVVELRDYALQVADAVAVRILVGAHEDFVPVAGVVVLRVFCDGRGKAQQACRREQNQYQFSHGWDSLPLVMGIL